MSEDESVGHKTTKGLDQVLLTAFQGLGVLECLGLLLFSDVVRLLKGASVTDI